MSKLSLLRQFSSWPRRLLSWRARTRNTSQRIKPCVKHRSKWMSATRQRLSSSSNNSSQQLRTAPASSMEVLCSSKINWRRIKCLSIWSRWKTRKSCNWNVNLATIQPFPTTIKIEALISAIMPHLFAQKASKVRRADMTVDIISLLISTIAV